MAGFGAKKDVVDSAKTTARVADANAPCKFSTLLDFMLSTLYLARCKYRPTYSTFKAVFVKYTSITVERPAM